MKITVNGYITNDFYKCQEYMSNKQLFCTLTEDLIEDSDAYDVYGSFIGYVISTNIVCDYEEPYVQWSITLAPIPQGKYAYSVYEAGTFLEAVPIMKENGEPDHLWLRRKM